MIDSLEGIRVVDLTQNLAGPFATRILGDLGADVVKVEPPEGDSARAWGPPFWGEDSALFLVANRNKRSIALDLKTDQGRATLERLARTADVFVQAFRPGVVEALGFGYEHVRALNPSVIYASLTAFGDVGPLRDQPGYDPLVQAHAGIMSLTGHPDGPPARVGGSVVDMGTGMWTAIAVLAALRERDRTGRGAHVETSLLDSALTWVSYHLVGYLSTGTVPGRMGSGLSSIAPYEAFPTRDGSLMIAAANDAGFHRTLEALGLEEHGDDVRFRDNPSRAAHRSELFELIAGRTREETTKGLLERLRKLEVPCAAILDVGQVVADPQVRATGMLEEAPHPRIEGFRDVATPLRLNGMRPPLRRVPPSPGEHADEIRRELGEE